MSRSIPAEPPWTLPQVALPPWCQRGDVEAACLPVAQDRWPEEMPATATGRLAGVMRPTLPGEFAIAVRSYAPFYEFGGPQVAGYHMGKYEGDGRGHSASLDATAREVQWTLVDMNKGVVLDTSCASDPSRGSGLLPAAVYELTGNGAREENGRLVKTARPNDCEAEPARVDGDLRLSQHVGASMPLSNLSPDIDVHTDFDLRMEEDRLHVSGRMTGDQFPSAEVVLTDPRGQTLLVHGYATSGGELSPYVELPFDGDADMGRFEMEVILDRDKNFIGVRAPGAGTVLTVDEWNGRLQGQGFKSSDPNF